MKKPAKDDTSPRVPGAKPETPAMTRAKVLGKVERPVRATKGKVECNASRVAGNRVRAL